MPKVILVVVAIAAVVAIAIVGVGAASLIPTSTTAGTPGPSSTAQDSPTVAAETPPPATPVVATTAIPTAAATLGPTAPPTASATSTPTPAPTAAPTSAASDTPSGDLNAREARWQAVVAEYLGDLPGTFGVVVKDLKNGDTYVLNGDKPFATASLYKLWLSTEVIRQGQAGKLDLNKKVTVEERHLSQSEFDEKLPAGLTVSLERSLWFLITLSSNSAAMLLNDYVEWSEVNALVKELGFQNSRMAPDPSQPPLGDWRDKSASSTPNEIARFFELAYTNKLIDPTVSEKVMYLLRNQQIDDRLSVKLPKGVVMAHKTGNLPGVINDVGIIFGPKTDLYVGVMSADADYESTTKALQGLGRALYDLEN